MDELSEEDKKIVARDMDYEIAAILAQGLSGNYYDEHHTVMVVKEEDYDISMGKCKYRLSCGRCDKYDKDCDSYNTCSHKWVSYGTTMITTKSQITPIGCYEYLLCEKCGKHTLRPYTTDAQGNIVNR